MNQHYILEAGPFEAYTEFDLEFEGEVTPRGLPVKFRTNFNQFRLEVARGIGRWTIFRSDQGRRALKHATDNDKVLKDIHKDLLNLGVSDGTSVSIIADFIYAGQGSSRRVTHVRISGFSHGGNEHIYVYGTAP
jgi:hypothetical protein